MIKIRKGIFETNSSSMHSFVLNKKGKNSVNMSDFAPYIKDGILTIEMNREFGWGPDKITDQYERACYAAVDAKYDDDRLERLARLLKKELDLKDVEFTGTKDEDGNFEDCFIDHQSQGMLDGVNLEDFIFGDGTLYIDNNNGCNYEDEYEKIEKNPDLERFY